MCGARRPSRGYRQPEAIPSSPIASAQKQDQLTRDKPRNSNSGPLLSCPNHGALKTLWPVTCGHAADPTGNFEDEVDFGGSEPRAHIQLRESREEQQPLAYGSVVLELTDKQATTVAQQLVASKSVILVSETFTEINAGLVIVLASGHRSPLQESDLVDPERDRDELAAVASKVYFGHVESYLATTQPPSDTETAVSSGLLACLDHHFLAPLGRPF